MTESVNVTHFVSEHDYEHRASFLA